MVPAAAAVGSSPPAPPLTPSTTVLSPALSIQSSGNIKCPFSFGYFVLRLLDLEKVIWLPDYNAPPFISKKFTTIDIDTRSFEETKVKSSEFALKEDNIVP